MQTTRRPDRAGQENRRTARPFGRARSRRRLDHDRNVRRRFNVVRTDPFRRHALRAARTGRRLRRRRICRHNSIPVIPGISQSRTTSRYEVLRISSKASWPFLADVTWCPNCVSALARMSVAMSSSSTIKMRSGGGTLVMQVRRAVALSPPARAAQS